MEEVTIIKEEQGVSTIIQYKKGILYWTTNLVRLTKS
jgi:hypothetical protein